MKKTLEKTLKDSIKEKTVIIGSKQVLGSLEKTNSESPDTSKKLKLIVTSSTHNSTTEKISSVAKKLNVPVVNFDGNSVALGKLSVFEYRISTVSFTNINDSDIKSLIADLKL